ncbi:MAG: nucleotidyltransferase domain-containing protein [bacterium]|nr:nucleotidyltransferase domain-containing protein [bacterium]
MNPEYWAVTPEKIAAATGRIASLENPRKIIVFGSAVSGKRQPRDVDILVVARGDVDNPRRESVRIRRLLKDIVMPMDIIVVSEDRFNDLVSRPGLIYGAALRSGKVLYEAG